MTERHDIAITGDIMLECLLRVPHLPEPNSTLIVDDQEMQIGGPAINLAWHFSQLGSRPKLVGCYGSHDQRRLEALFRGRDVDLSRLVGLNTASDLLVAMLTETAHHSIYVRSPAIPDLLDHLKACSDAALFVLNGSRHQAFRKAYMSIARHGVSGLLAFNPSYSIYEYNSDELTAIIEAADITILNELETQHVFKLLDCEDSESLSRRVPGRVVSTYQERGADIWRSGHCVHVESLSNADGDFIGAGDTFFSGLLHEVLSGHTPEASAVFAATYASFAVDQVHPRPVTNEAEVRQRLKERVVQRSTRDGSGA